MSRRHSRTRVDMSGKHRGKRGRDENDHMSSQQEPEQQQQRRSGSGYSMKDIFLIFTSILVVFGLVYLILNNVQAPNGKETIYNSVTRKLTGESEPRGTMDYVFIVAGFIVVLVIVFILVGFKGDVKKIYKAIQNGKFVESVGGFFTGSVNNSGNVSGDASAESGGSYDPYRNTMSRKVKPGGKKSQITLVDIYTNSKVTDIEEKIKAYKKIISNEEKSDALKKKATEEIEVLEKALIKAKAKVEKANKDAEQEAEASKERIRTMRSQKSDGKKAKLKEKSAETAGEMEKIGGKWVMPYNVLSRKITQAIGIADPERKHTAIEGVIREMIKLKEAGGLDVFDEDKFIESLHKFSKIASIVYLITELKNTKIEQK